MPSKSGSRLSRKLDARPDRLDLRDREFVPLVKSLPRVFPDDAQIRDWLPRYVDAGLILDQGEEGACTGFGLACVANYLFWRRSLEHGSAGPVETVSPRMFYHLARFYDEWPGEDYEGSSCRGALKAWHKHGVCKDSLWPYRDENDEVLFVQPGKGWDADATQRRIGVYYRINHASVVDMQAAILQIGAVYVASDVHDGWTLGRSRKALNGHASLPMIRPIRRADSMGGHAFALVGFNPTGFVVQNSWGTGWGNRGFAILPYEQWVKYGADAWVCALGVPKDTRATSSSVIRGSTRAGIARASSLALVNEPVLRRPPVSKPVSPWDETWAYRHSVVLGNDGRVINRIVTHESGEAGVARIVAAAGAWFEKNAGTPKKLVLYAHGGLNSEHASIERIRVLAPYFAANGIYPIFLTWKTGPIETVSDILADELERVPRPEGDIRDYLDRVRETASEVLDRTIEVAASPVAKPIWSQMKQNAAGSTQSGHGGQLIANALAELAAQTEFELHLVGHSAGSILLGHFLGLLPERNLIARSCSLYAPACSVRFALDHYKSAVDAGVLDLGNLHIHTLSDQRERDDTVGPYRKSLLYLVSRALESCHKMPVLGLALAFDRSRKVIAKWNEREQASVREWQTFWGTDNRNLHILEDSQVSTGKKGRFIKAAHGCFDNDTGAISATLRRILRKLPEHAVESLDY